MDRLTRSLAVLSTTCAVLMTGLVIRKELIRPTETVQVQQATRSQTVQLDNWDELIAINRWSGSERARVRILEFGDLECPACAWFHRHSLPWIRTAYGDSVTFGFRHWPLDYHRFAFPAASAAECAGRQGRFFEFITSVYDNQDSLGLLQFDAFAARAGITDIAAFNLCTAGEGSFPSIEGDTRAARSLGARGTPAIIVDGMLFSGAPDSVALDRAIRAAIVKKYSSN